MQTLRRSSVFVTLLVMLFSMVLSIAPIHVNKASAEKGDKILNQAQAWKIFYDFSQAVNVSANTEIKGPIDPDNATSYREFNGGCGSTIPGALLSPGDGKWNCDSYPSIVTPVLANLGYADGQKFLQDPAFHFTLSSANKIDGGTVNEAALESVLFNTKNWPANLDKGSLKSGTAPKFVQYLGLLAGVQICSAVGASNMYNFPATSATAAGDKLWLVGPNSNAAAQFSVQSHASGEDASDGSDITIGGGLGVGEDENGQLTCGQIKTKLLDKSYADAYVAALGSDKTGTTAAPTGATGTTTATTASPTIECKSSPFNPLSWFLCPLATTMQSLAAGLDDQINNFLEVDTTPCTSDSAGTHCASPNDINQYKSTWSIIRNLALGLIVIAALVAIVSQALGFELLDAYSLRKVLPRLFITVIGITISWPLIVWFIQLTNDLGIGVRQLIYAPFSANSVLKVQLGGGSQVAIGIIGSAAIAILGFAALLSFAATAALAAAVAFLVLTLRQMLIVMLVIFSPIAIACYILPNTQKIWKLWWESFSKGLLMFPIISAFIAIGRVFAAVSSQDSSSTIQQIIAFTAYFAPYFLIPFTVRLAGGAISTIGGLVNDRGRGGFDRLKKYRGGKIAQNTANMKNYSRVGDKTMIGRGINTALGATTHPMDALRGRKGIQGGRLAGRAIQGANAFKEDPTITANMNDDNFLLALADRSVATEKLGQSQKDYRAAVSAHGMNSSEALGMKGTMDARQRALDAAGRVGVNSRNSAGVRMAALQSLAKTGYQFEAGQEGYDQLDTMVKNITNGDEGARIAAMDEAQFNLKNAGRYDLGGINHGARFDAANGMAKVDPYTMATRAKPETIQTKGKLMRTAIREARAAQAAGRTDEYNAKMETAEVHRRELMNGWDGATGKNRDEFLKAMNFEPPKDASDPIKTARDAAEYAADAADLKVWAEAPSSAPAYMKEVKENYVAGKSLGFTPQDIARGYRTIEKVQQQNNGDVANTKARGARRPNAAELDP